MAGSDFRDEFSRLKGKTGERVVEDLLRYSRNVERLNAVLCAPYADLDELLHAYIETGCDIFGLETALSATSSTVPITSCKSTLRSMS
ncbi:MAG: hypothetical protein ACI9TH_004312 [Kiritimatiellia bacterium]|jgi:hypothetical protein